MEVHNVPQDHNFRWPGRILEQVNLGLAEDAGLFGKYGEPPEYTELIEISFPRNATLRGAILERNVERFQRILAAGEDCRINVLDESGFGAIHYAAKHGFMEGICLLIAHKATIDLKTQNGSTALHIAIRHRQNEVAKFLLEQGSSPNLVEEMGLNALLLAVKKGLSDVVAKIFEIKAVDINVADLKQNTTLHFAAIANDTEIFEMLLDNSASLDYVNTNRETPLHLAVAEGNMEIIEVILDSIHERIGSSFSICDYINQRREDKRTALHLAVQTGRLEVTNILLKNGADVTALANDGSSVLHFAASSGNVSVLKRLLVDSLQVNMTDNRQRTALHRALYAGHMEAAMILVNNNADVNAKDDQDLTPLLLAVINNNVKFLPVLLKLGASLSAQDINLKNSMHYATENGNIEAARLLLEAKKSIQHDVDAENQTPIHYATKLGYDNVLELFMTQTAQLSDTDLYGNTALHLAAQFGNVRCIEMLTRDTFTGLINLANEEQQTPLHVAIMNNQEEACKALLKGDADINCQDKSKWTPLHYASLQESTGIMQMLLETDVDINAQDHHLKTPLMVSAEKGNVSSVMMLLARGADINLCDADGDNFLDIAIDYNMVEVCAAVLESDRWKEVLSTKDEHGCHFMKKLIQMCPDITRIVLDRSTTFSDHHPDHAEFSVTYDYRFLEEKPQTQSVFSDTNSIIKGQRNELYFAPRIMAEYRREHLMAHPITSSLFQVKWKRLCRYVYYLSFLTYGIFVASLSILVVFQGISYTSFLEKSSQLNLTERTNKNETHRLPGMPRNLSNFTQILSYLLFGFCSLQIAKEVIQLVVLRLRYFLSLTNYIEIILYGGALYFANHFRTRPVIDDRAYELGIISVFLAWSNTLLFLQRIPMYRLYVVMFLKVCLTIIRLLMVFSIIIGAFALTFFLLFTRQKSFYPLSISALKVLVMMAGEFEFSTSITSKIGQKDSKQLMYVPYPTLSYAVFITFVFLVAVAFTNLLIGLAVGDIENVRKLATVSIFEQQLEFIDTLQGIIPKYFLKRFVYVASDTVLVNKQTGWQRFMSTITSDTTTEDLKRLRAKQAESESKIIRLKVQEGEIGEASERRSFIHEEIGKKKTIVTDEKIVDATVICNNQNT